MTPTNTIQTNIAARHEAETLLELVGEQPPRFWEVLAELATSKLPPKPAPIDPFAPMDDQEAIRFEAKEMPYGSYAGTAIGEVSCQYIGFIAENDFAIKLRRYVKSRRFLDRQDQE
jgi:hypothetical protein